MILRRHNILTLLTFYDSKFQSPMTIALVLFVGMLLYLSMDLVLQD